MIELSLAHELAGQMLSGRHVEDPLLEHLRHLLDELLGLLFGHFGEVHGEQVLR